MTEIKITYETLFDLLRREKGRGELQQLEATFYEDVSGYIQEKKKTVTMSSSRGEQEKIRIQLKNIKKILRELYELREKKTISLASSKVRTNSNLIDTSKLLTQEKRLFDEACELFQKYKTQILEQSLGEDASRYEYATSTKIKEQPKEQDEEEKVKISKKQEEDEEIQITILHDLPRFLGIDKKIYGPYKKGELANMPQLTAKLLLDKKRAEKI